MNINFNRTGSLSYDLSTDIFPRGRSYIKQEEWVIKQETMRKGRRSFQMQACVMRFSSTHDVM